MNENYIIIYTWFLKNKMSVYVKDANVYYSGMWWTRKHQDITMSVLYWGNQVEFFKKYAVNK